MQLLLAAAVLLLASSASATLTAVTRSGRLMEQEITLPVQRRAEGGAEGANGVPVVDPPRRFSGYFKLNRTHDAVSRAAARVCAAWAQHSCAHATACSPAAHANALPTPRSPAAPTSPPRSICST